MKKISNRANLIVWDSGLLIGTALYLFLNASANSNHQNLIVGFITAAVILPNSIRNHIAAYKLNGKIY